MEHDGCVCVADTHKRTRWEAFCDALTTNPFGSLFVNVSAQWVQVFLSVLLSWCGKNHLDNKQKRLHAEMLADFRQKDDARKVQIDRLVAEFGKILDDRNGRSKQLCSGMSSGSAQVLNAPGEVLTAAGPSSTEELSDDQKTSLADEFKLAPMSMSSHKDSEANLEEIICEVEKLSANGDVNVMKGSTILETKVALRSNLLGRLHAIAVDRTRNDKKFTLQLDRKRLFFYTGKQEWPEITCPCLLSIAMCTQFTILEKFQSNHAEDFFRKLVNIQKKLIFYLDDVKVESSVLINHCCCTCKG